MAFINCKSFIAGLSCELTGLVLVTGLCIVWILGWTGCLPGVSNKLKNIQSYSALVNTVYGIFSAVILIALGIRSKRKLAMRRAAEQERTGLINSSVAQTYDAVENIRSDNEATNALIQENMQVIVSQNRDLLTNCRRMLDILDSPSSPLVVTKKLRTIDRDTKDVPHLVKIVLVGDLATGKTSLLKRWTYNSFSATCRATIGVDFCLRVITTNVGEFCVQAWDVAGVEIFGNNTKLYYRRSVCFLILFDISRLDSTLSMALRWYDDIIHRMENKNDYYVAFACNKIDLLPFIVDHDQQKIDEQLNGMPCFYVSARTGENVDHAFSLIALGAIVKDFTRHKITFQSHNS